MASTEKDIVEELSYDSANNIRLNYLNYAMEEYSLSKKQIGDFFKKYDQAVDYYKAADTKKNIVRSVFAVLGNVAGGAGIILANVSGYNIIETLIASGVITGCLGVGIVNTYKLLTKDNAEYSLTKKNPYIKQGTTFEEMAHEYCKVKKRFNEKA